MVKTVKAAEMTLIHSLFYFLSSLGLVIACQAASADNQTKNIVLILADDLGWADTTLYGKTSFYETPNIERLAARGMTFSNAYASPICSPTRASIMTGQNPARHGMTAPAAHLADERFEATVSERGVPDQKCTNVKSATRLDPDLPTLGKVLHNAGYATAHFGKWHLGREPYSPLESGFDVDYKIDSALEIAEILKTKWSLGVDGGVLVTNPIPVAFELESSIMNKAINQAITEADQEHITGKEITPYLLSKVNEITEGKSLDANIKLIQNNADLAAKIAIHYSKQD